MSMSQETKIRRKLAKVATKQSTALEGFQRLLGNKDSSAADIERAQRELARLGAEQSRLMSELRIVLLEEPQRFGGYGAAAGQRPMREQVLEMLNEIGVPAAPRIISDFAAACCALVLPPARFASLRRDESEAFKKNPGSRPAWIVPALNASSLTAMPRIVASSAWESERRLIGNRTLRVNHLQTLLSLIRSRKRLQQADEQRARQMDAMIARFASSVMGALEAGKPLDYGRIEGVTITELEHVEPLDLVERRKAASKLSELPLDKQFWGCTPLVLVDRSKMARS